jgi:putative tricarboxylic transport membrane protein
MKRYLVTIIRSGFIGTFIGIVPGTGGPIAAFLAYSEAKRFSKHPEEFGKGAPEGVAAAESANNATTGGTLVPMLTLGIPGDAVTAVLVGAFMIQGLQPGPLLFVQHGRTVFALFAGLFVANIILWDYAILLRWPMFPLGYRRPSYSCSALSVLILLPTACWMWV